MEAGWGDRQVAGVFGREGIATALWVIRVVEPKIEGFGEPVGQITFSGLRRL